MTHEKFFETIAEVAGQETADKVREKVGKNIFRLLHLDEGLEKNKPYSWILRYAFPFHLEPEGADFWWDVYTDLVKWECEQQIAAILKRIATPKKEADH